MTDPCVRCGLPAVHTHHRKLRSQGGDDSPENLIRLCLTCHTWVHENPAEAYETGYLVHSWGDPETVEVLRMIATDYTVGGLRPLLESARSAVVDVEYPISDEDLLKVAPGETCDRCHRRVPHPKKPSSPKTKVFSVRVPLEELGPWEEALDAAASHLGLGSAPHHRFQTLNAGIALILQSPKGLLG